MLSREVEERHLREADGRIADARLRLGHFQMLIDGAIGQRQDVEQATRALSSMAEVLAAFVAHREFIVHALADIDAGRL